MLPTRILQALLLILGLGTLHSACARDTPTPQARLDTIVLGMGCFWGAEKRMSDVPGVVDVESGYANGDIEGSYRAVLAHERAAQSGKTRQRNHAEVVKVTFDPTRTTQETVLIKFWESHDPTQGDRQGNDIGSNYRSAIYTHSQGQEAVALKTRTAYQQALTRAGRGAITTEIAPLKNYFAAEDSHQDYLKKNTQGYCGLGGTGVKYPASGNPARTPARSRLDGQALAFDRQLVVFEAEDCTFCKRFKADILDRWQSPIAVARTLDPKAPAGWKLDKPLFATPTIVLFQQGKETARYTGYSGDHADFWKWLGVQTLTPGQQTIAFGQGTERAFTGSHLDQNAPAPSSTPSPARPFSAATPGLKAAPAGPASSAP